MRGTIVRGRNRKEDEPNARRAMKARTTATGQANLKRPAASLRATFLCVYVAREGWVDSIQEGGERQGGARGE